MKALVYQGHGKKDWIEKAKPEVQKPTDVIVKITVTTICGTDLHILRRRARGHRRSYARA